MTAVKICGLRRLEDVAIVNELRPEYVGFVFAPSRRQVTIEQVEILVATLAPHILRVGVFLDHSLSFIRRAVETDRLDVVQLHGSESPSFCRELAEVQVWKSFSVRNPASLDAIPRYDVNGYLLDAYHPQMAGGSGQSFDWELAAGLSQKVHLILAGGLHPGNVRRAIATVQPQVVDVSSGVERDGCKDEALVRQFIDEVRRDASIGNS